MFIPSSKHGWFGNFSSWKQAEKKCSGYDNEVILEKVKEATLKVVRGEAAYERDSVAFQEHEYSSELLSAFETVSENGPLRLVDFGGALGSEYFQYRRFFEGKKIDWRVVEQKHFVEAGNKFIKNDQLSFYFTVEDAMKNEGPETLLLSSVLPYLEKPYEWINKFLLMGFDYIIIDRNAYIDGNDDRLTIQIVPEFIYKASYPSWFFNEEKFLKVFREKYDLLSVFPSPFAPPVEIEGLNAAWKGYLFKKKK